MKKKKIGVFFIGVTTFLFSAVCIHAETLRMVEHDMQTGQEKIVELEISENISSKEEGIIPNTLQSRIVVGDDERQPVDDTTVFPMSAVGRLEYKMDGSSYAATGWLYGPNCLVTNAHVVKNSIQMYFTPGRNYVLSPFGKVEVIKTYYPEEYNTDYNEASCDWDFGFALLAEPIGNRTGYFSYLTTGTTYADSVECLGYPIDRLLNGKPLQMSSFGKIVGKETGTLRTIRHTLDTEHGSSGSPLFVYDSSLKPVVVAIHSMGPAINAGVSIDAMVGGAMSLFKKGAL